MSVLFGISTRYSLLRCIISVILEFKPYFPKIRVTRGLTQSGTLCTGEYPLTKHNLSFFSFFLFFYREISSLWTNPFIHSKSYLTSFSYFNFLTIKGVCVFTRQSKERRRTLRLVRAVNVSKFIHRKKGLYEYKILSPWDRKTRYT